MVFESRIAHIVLMKSRHDKKFLFYMPAKILLIAMLNNVIIVLENETNGVYFFISQQMQYKL